MNKHYLLSKMKSSGTAYLCWFFLGFHYAYLGYWGLQFLYWFTLGGLGIWCLVDLFHIPTKVNNYNMIISRQIAAIEKKEQDEVHARNLAMIAAVKGN
jgi:L-rhamnose isomerase